jgi:cytochrome d ubiquinol oxidase subunit II
MEAIQAHLPGIWFWIIGFVLLIYIILDGFDLGLGMLCLFFREKRRAVLIGSIGSVWHANQTWLVVMGGLIFGAFPFVYGVVTSAFYVPVILLLFGFILRAVAIEFHHEAQRKWVWNLVLAFGSFLATLVQGFIAGVFFQGIAIKGGHFAGGAWDWVNPFNAVVGGAFVFGYMVLGAAYMIFKTEGKLQYYGFRAALTCSILALVAGGAVCMMVVQQDMFIMKKWFQWPSFVITFLPLALAAFSSIGLIRSIWLGEDYNPFYWCIAIVSLSVIGLAASMYPYIIPPAITVADAAAQPVTLKILFVVVGIMLPIMLVYNAYLYHVFRGKSEDVYSD